MHVLNNKSGITRTLFLVGVLVILVGGFYIFNDRLSSQSAAAVQSQKTATPTAFVMETYSTIKKHFWKDLSDDQLHEFFARGIGRVTAGGEPDITSKEELRAVLQERFNEEVGKNKPARLVDLVLRSLPPQSRSRVYTQKKEKQLAKRVQNVNTKTDLYQVLGVSKEASQEDIKRAYEKKKQTLEAKPQSTSTKKKLSQINYAKKVLGDSADRKQYDSNKSEPTVFTERVSPDTVHLAIHRYNRQTLQEFQQAVNAVDTSTTTPNNLVLDLRSNLGGSVDILPYLLGPFIGPERAAYDFFQQGETKTYRTKTGWLNALVPYKKVVILVDKQTQSTGELMASVLKKFNVGVLVGETTRGWGTIERVFGIDNQYRADREYSLFMVHHLTQRADGKPIQGNGVIPEVQVRSDNWQDSLYEYIPDDSLVNQVEVIWSSPPEGTQI